MKRLLILLAALLMALPAAAEEELTTAYILCQPNDYINVRAKPTTRSESYGRFVCGDYFKVDGKLRKKFLHVQVSLESNEGWIFSGYVVYDEPVFVDQQFRITANGRVAARRYIGGPRRCWLKKNSIVTVSYYSEEWCITNKGFIQTKYLTPCE